MISGRYRGQLGMALALGLSVVVAGCTLTPEEQAEMIEETLVSDEATRGQWQAIKEEYPKEFAALIEQIRVKYDENGNDLAAAIEANESWLLKFHDRIRPDVMRAPAEALLDWSTVDYELLSVLEKEDVEQCAKVVRGEATVIASEIPKVNAAIGDRAEATIRAAAAGRDDPQDYKEPSDAQFIKFEDAIRKTGLEDSTLEAFATGDGMSKLSVAQQCEVGVSLAEAIEALPDTDAAQLTAHMLKQGPN